MWNNDRASKRKHTAAFRTIYNRWKEYFRDKNIYVWDLTSGPMAVAILEGPEESIPPAPRNKVDSLDMILDMAIFGILRTENRLCQ
jgi:hypothetical protein